MSDDIKKPAETPATEEPKAAEDAFQPRRRAVRGTAPVARQTRGRIPYLWIVGTLVVGLLIGAVAARARYKAKDVVVAVNGVTIDKDTLFRRLELTAGPQAVRQLIGEELQVQFAKKRGVLPRQSDVDARYKKLAENKDFLPNLARSGQTPDEFKHTIYVQLCQANILTAGMSVTDADIRRFYDENTSKTNPQAKYYTPDVVQIAVIVTPTQPKAAQARRDLDSGTSFPMVAKTYSEDKSKQSGGVLPPIPRGRTKSRNVPGLEDAIFAMKIGETLGPAKFAGVWWIIRCLDKRSAATVPFTKVTEECRTGAMLAKGVPANGKRAQEEFVEFQKAANIQAFWRQYKSVVRVD